MESGRATAPPYVAGPLHLAPFRALWLAPRQVGDPASARAFARPYRGVRHRLETWQERGLAERDERPAVYLHEYSDSGLTVRGLVGCLDISHRAASPGERRVLPHEGVHGKQVTDLADRMAAMGMNPAPILLVHHGPATVREVSRAVRARTPLREYVDHADQQHRVWAITDPGQLELIDAGLAQARLLVADGHHRYAAYVALHKRDHDHSDGRRGGRDDAGDPDHDRAHRTGLAMVIDQDETPLFLGAIHRLLHGARVADLVAAAERAGAEVRTIGADAAVAALAPDTLVLSDGSSWATVTCEVPPGWAMVQLLDSVLLEGLPRPPSRIGFAHSVADTLALARPGRVTAVLLPAVDLDRVLALADHGRLLPEKATSFQPKPSLGSFIRLLDE